MPEGPLADEGELQAHAGALKVFIVLHGQLDSLTSSGYVEGWAFDDADRLRPLSVCVRAGGVELASGIANRYRWDLAEAGCGTGWCAFRLRLGDSPLLAPDTMLSLHEVPSGAEIAQAAVIPRNEEGEAPLALLEEIVRSDPTLIQSIEQLRGCGPVFDAFIDNAGIDRFVHAAYIYILGRTADAPGLASYAANLRDASMTPYEMLVSLQDCAEFRAGATLLLAPPEPGFAFRPA